MREHMVLRAYLLSVNIQAWLQILNNFIGRSLYNLQSVAGK